MTPKQTAGLIGLLGATVALALLYSFEVFIDCFPGPEMTLLGAVVDFALELIRYALYVAWLGLGVLSGAVLAANRVPPLFLFILFVSFSAATAIYGLADLVFATQFYGSFDQTRVPTIVALFVILLSASSFGIWRQHGRSVD